MALRGCLFSCLRDIVVQTFINSRLCVLIPSRTMTLCCYFLVGLGHCSPLEQGWLVGALGVGSWNLLWTHIGGGCGGQIRCGLEPQLLVVEQVESRGKRTAGITQAFLPILQDLAGSGMGGRGGKEVPILQYTPARSVMCRHFPPRKKNGHYKLITRWVEE